MKARIPVAVVLAIPLLTLTLFGLFFVFSGIDGLDGVGTWDGSCFEVGFGHAWLAILIGATIPSGLWAALAAWVARKRWWRGGLLLAALGITLAATSYAYFYVSNERFAGRGIEGQRCVDERASSPDESRIPTP